MSVQDTENTMRSTVHAMWAGVASRWADYADYVDERAAGVTAAMLAQSAPGPGDQVLELACGPGGLGLAAAERVAPGGEVVLSDVAAGMTEIAADRAAERRLTNVRTAVLDLEEIDVPDAGFDVVLCRDGLMFAVEPARALAEIHRVLRPGGRLAIAVWGSRERNPWLGLVFDAVSAQVGAPVPPPGVPGPLSLGDGPALQGLLTASGLVDVVLEEVPAPLCAASFEAWWDRTTALTGPLATLLSRLPQEATGAIVERLRGAVEPYLTDSGLELPGLSLVASGTKPR